MTEVTMLEMRKSARQILNKVGKGETLLLTYRGKPIAEIHPVVKDDAISRDDPFYKITELTTGDIKPLSNEEIDKVLYE